VFCSGATGLRVILLSENKLTKLPKGVFSNITNERLAVELWRNEFVCDCQLKWFKEWIDQVTSPHNSAQSFRHDS